MLSLLTQGQFGLFAIILFAIVFSLTFHEYGHAASAKMLGDDTAERAGRLNLNPVSHIDPMGLLMVVLVGFGYAKPVPVNPSRLRYPWADAAVAAAGPFMNLMLAIVCANLLKIGLYQSEGFLSSEGTLLTLRFLAQINLLLMLFNLIPLGPLDGRYVAEWLLPRSVSLKYSQFNQHYGNYVFLALIVASIAGLPVFQWLFGLSQQLLPLIVFV